MKLRGWFVPLLVLLVGAGCGPTRSSARGDDDDDGASDDDDGSDDDDDAADDDDDAADDDDDDVTPPHDDDDAADDDDDGPCWDQPLVCPSGLSSIGSPGQLVVVEAESPFEADADGMWSCADAFVEVSGSTSGFSVLWEPLAGYLVDFVAPDGSVLYDAALGEWSDEDEQAALLDAVLIDQVFFADPRITFSGTATSLLLPSSPSIDPEPGCYGLRFAVPGSVTGTAEYNVSVNRRSVGTRLDFHVVIADGAGIFEAQVLDVLTLMRPFLTGYGLDIGEVTFESISSSWSVLDVPNDFSNLMGVSGGAPGNPAAVPLFFVWDLQDPGQPALLGRASGIPGRLGAPGSAQSGVAMEVLAWTGANGLLDLWELDPLAMTTLHEVGHFLGLRHSTESNGYHDPLTDTPECTASTISRDACEGAGAENLMFPIAPTTSLGIALSPQQADVLEAMLPGPAWSCSSHDVCDDHEICYDGNCMSAYWRFYTMYIDQLDVASSGPTGAWDYPSGAPDPFLGWSTVAGSGSFPTVDNSYSAQWFGTVDIFATASGTPISLTAWDEDVAVHDVIDNYGGGPIPVEDLRSPYATWTGAWSTLSTGFEAQ